MGRVKFTSRMNLVVAKTEQDLDLAVAKFAADTDRLAKVNAPKDTRALVNSGRIVRNASANYSIVFGGGRVPYALRRHYENKKNPGTLRYLERAGDTNARNFRKYL